MKRVLAVAALAVAAAPMLAVSPASAAPSACLSINVDVNGTGQSQNICLPPSGSLS